MKGETKKGRRNSTTTITASLGAYRHILGVRRRECVCVCARVRARVCVRAREREKGGSEERLVASVWRSRRVLRCADDLPRLPPEPPLSACVVGQTKRLSGLYLSEESSLTCARAAKPCALHCSPWPRRDTLDNSHASWGSCSLRRIAHSRPVPGTGQHIVMTDLVCQRGWLLIFFPLFVLFGFSWGGNPRWRHKAKKLALCATGGLFFGQDAGESELWAFLRVVCVSAFTFLNSKHQGRRGGRYPPKYPSVRVSRCSFTQSCCALCDSPSFQHKH